MRIACLKPDGYAVHHRLLARLARRLLLARAAPALALGASYSSDDGRLSFVVDDEMTMEKVIGEGVAELVERPNVGGQWVEVATRMSLRYLGEDGPDVPHVRR